MECLGLECIRIQTPMLSILTSPKRVHLSHHQPSTYLSTLTPNQQFKNPNLGKHASPLRSNEVPECSGKIESSSPMVLFPRSGAQALEAFGCLRKRVTSIWCISCRFAQEGRTNKYERSTSTRLYRSLLVAFGGLKVAGGDL